MNKLTTHINTILLCFTAIKIDHFCLAIKSFHALQYKYL